MGRIAGKEKEEYTCFLKEKVHKSIWAIFTNFIGEIVAKYEEAKE